MRELHTSMGSLEVTYWAAYERLYGPLGQGRDDILAAMVCERVTSMLTGKKGARRRIRIEDFIPKWGGKDKGRRQNAWEQKSALTALFSRFMNRGGRGGDHD